MKHATSSTGSGGSSSRRLARPAPGLDVRVTFDDPVALAADLLALPVALGADPLAIPAVRAIDERLGGVLAEIVAEEGFRGKRDQLVVLHTHGRIGPKRVALIGLGVESKSTAVAALRAFAAGALRIASSHSLGSVSLLAPAGDLALADTVRICCEGAHLGAYRFDRHRTDPQKRPAVTEVWICAAGSKTGHPLRAAVDKGAVVGSSIAFARDLVNEPANDMTPRTLGDHARRIARQFKLGCTIFGKTELDKKGFGLLSAVNRGSAEEPRLIHLAYRPRGRSSRRVAIIGKGITFDSGGLCLKPAKSQITMKCDMSGAALVLGTMQILAQLKPNMQVDGIIAATENMPGPEAYRPGDVFASYGGKTVEVINTDAEGRLVLADAIGYAATFEPDLIIDHATLTGACMTALGPYTAGLFSNDPERARSYAAAAGRAGEDMWPMPLVEQLLDGLKSDVADLKNVGEEYGGAISAALFLREFVGKTPWIHVDMAGPAFADKPQGSSSRGATGYGILTLVEYLTSGAD